MINLFVKVNENEPWRDYGVLHKEDLEVKLAEITTDLGEFLYYTTEVVD